MEAREANSRDRESWLHIRRTIWPQASPSAHGRDIDAGFARQDGRWFVVVEEDSNPVAYLECRLSPAQDGGEGSTGRIEAWYIQPNNRAGGVGRALIKFLRAWFRVRGCESLEVHQDLAGDTAFRADWEDPPFDEPLFFNSRFNTRRH